MSVVTSSNSLETIFPVQWGDRVRYAQGVKAGPWVFATGHLAQDYRTGIAGDVIGAGFPFAADSKHAREGRAILRNLGAVLERAGCSFTDTVRLDQYYTNPTAVLHYQRERREALKSHIPPSTSVVMNGFVLPEADIGVDAIAFCPSDETKIATFDRSDISAAKNSGYKPALRAGHLVFVAGATAEAQAGDASIGGVAIEAHPHEGRRWQGAPIATQTKYVIDKKLIPALQLAGSSLANVVKAQVYLTDMADVDLFHRVWLDYFGKNPPVTTILPCSPASLAVEAARVEINLIAVADDAAIRVERFGQGLLPGFDYYPAAIKAGDLLFIAGLMALGPDGLAPEVRRDSRQPYFMSHPQAQAEHILSTAEQVCGMAGTSLKNVVRAQQFQTSIGEFYPIHSAWRAYAPELHVPFSAIEIAGKFPVPDARLLMDLWVYAAD